MFHMIYRNPRNFVVVEYTFSFIIRVFFSYTIEIFQGFIHHTHTKDVYMSFGRFLFVATTFDNECEDVPHDMHYLV